MSVNLNQAHAQLDDMGWALHPAMNDFDRQSLRILRCAARTMMAADSPGGLRFKAGSQPWPGGVSASHGRNPPGNAVNRRPDAHRV